MLNKYLWDLYLNSEGKSVVETFEHNLTQVYSEDYATFVSDLHKNFNPSETINKSLFESLIAVIDDLDSGYFFDRTDNIDVALNEFYENNLKDFDNSPKEFFEIFSYYIENYTTLFAIELPQLFIPYYFKYNFNVLEIISKEFDIELPPIPLKKDYKGRVLYYGDLCVALNKFRDDNCMTPYELYAFLYDFAPKYIGGVNSYIVKDLPEPRDCFFIGGSKDDAFLSHENGTITPWQCNPETLAGDMIVMYLKTPISAIDSIWRSVSIGFNDPFFYYYRCTYIGRPERINQIPQETLKTDLILKNLPIVRKNMQGVNGVELYPSVYNHLLDISNSDLPRFANIILNTDNNIVIEKDVEKLLVKPLLERLNYSPDEYVQQLQIRVGNHNFKLIPDFVIKPTLYKGHTSAEIIIEAKLTIPNKKTLDEVEIQLRSYAKQLGTKYAVIASKEKLWVYKKKDDYSDVILTYTWNDLNDSDNWNILFKLIGNRGQ